MKNSCSWKVSPSADEGGLRCDMTWLWSTGDRHRWASGRIRTVNLWPRPVSQLMESVIIRSGSNRSSSSRYYNDVSLRFPHPDRVFTHVFLQIFPAPPQLSLTSTHSSTFTLVTCSPRFPLSFSLHLWLQSPTEQQLMIILITDQSADCFHH